MHSAWESAASRHLYSAWSCLNDRAETERAINYPSSPVVYRDLSADSRLATGDPRLINQERAAVAEMAPPASLKVATAAAVAVAA